MYQRLRRLSFYLVAARHVALTRFNQMFDLASGKSHERTAACNWPIERTLSGLPANVLGLAWMGRDML